jgi:hypothetical protein
VCSPSYNEVAYGQAIFIGTTAYSNGGDTMPDPCRHTIDGPPPPLGRHHITDIVCDILAQDFNRTDRILIPPRYTFFFGSLATKNLEVKRAWPEVMSGWVIDRKVFSGAHK